MNEHNADMGEIEGIENIMPTADGHIQFTLRATTPKAIWHMRTFCKLSVVTDMFWLLACAAEVAAQFTGAGTDPENRDLDYVIPVRAQGIGLRAGSAPVLTTIIVKLRGFNVSFEIATSDIVHLADDFERAARGLAPPDAEPTN